MQLDAVCTDREWSGGRRAFLLPQAARDLPAYGRCARRSHTRASPRGSRRRNTSRRQLCESVSSFSGLSRITSSPSTLGHGIPVGDHEIRVQTERLAHAAGRRPHTQQARTDARAETRGCNRNRFPRAAAKIQRVPPLVSSHSFRSFTRFIQLYIAFVTGFRNFRHFRPPRERRSPFP